MTKPKERRKYPRLETYNLLSYICLDEEGSQLGQGVGKALNISPGGIQIESYAPVKTDKILLYCADVNNDLMEITGKVIYCTESGPGIFKTGIQFLEDEEKIRHIVVNLEKAYKLQKKYKS